MNYDFYFKHEHLLPRGEKPTPCEDRGDQRTLMSVTQDSLPVFPLFHIFAFIWFGLVL